MKKVWINLSIVFLTFIVLGIWFIGFAILLNIFPAETYTWLDGNLPIVNTWIKIIHNDFTLVQSVAFYLLMGSGALFFLISGFQYLFYIIEKIRRLSFWINIPLYSVALAGIVISLILLFVNLL